MADHNDTQQDRKGEQQRSERQESTPPVLDRLDQFYRQLSTAGARRLFLGLDFDGTLAPHVDDPAAAELTSTNRRVLEALSRRQAVDIAVISGRALDDVRTRVGISGIEYAGNHGLELDDPSARPDAAQYRSTIRTVCQRLETKLDTIPGCEIENKEITATVHYRTAEDDVESRIRSIIETVVESVERDTDDDGTSSDSSLCCTSGANIVEIRPAIDWDKGDAVRWFIRDCPDECLAMYIGDDTTDEDVFRAIAPDGIGVHVGTDETAATYRVADVEEVTRLLRWLADTGLDRLTEDTDGDRNT